MPREPLPEDLRRFILTSVPSVPFVEALLLLRATGAPMTAEDLARRIYVSPRVAADVLQQLQEAGVLQSSDPDLAGMVDLLAVFYRTHLVEVTDLIHSRTARKAQQFADAFKIRKDS
jgi:hypothetical protein